MHNKKLSFQRFKKKIDDGEYNAIVKAVKFKDGKLIVEYLVNGEAHISSFYDPEVNIYQPLWYFLDATIGDVEGDILIDDLERLVVGKELNVEILNVINDKGKEHCNISRVYPYSPL